MTMAFDEGDTPALSQKPCMIKGAGGERIDTTGACRMLLAAYIEQLRRACRDCYISL